MRSLLKISHTLKTFYAKLHLLICESDCQNCGLIFKMHMVALFNLIIQLRYGPLWLCWREKHWLYIVWLAPPLRQPAIWFFAELQDGAEEKLGGEEDCWMARMTLNLHLAKRQIFKRISKSSRDRKDENVSLLWHFVVFLLTTWPRKTLEGRLDGSL